MSALDVVVALLVGGVAGAYAGLLGVGGGVIMVPGMVLLLSETQATAEGTSLLVIIPTTFVASRSALARRLVDAPVAGRLALGGVLGAAAGSLLAVRVIESETALKRIFGAFLLLVALRMIVRPPRAREGEPAGER